MENGQTKAVAQKTVVIEANDAVYLLQLNIDCLADQIDKVLPATATIDENDDQRRWIAAVRCRNLGAWALTAFWR